MIRTYVFLGAIALGTSSFVVVEKAFFIERGMSFVELGMLTSIFNIIISFVELPLSIIFDRNSLKMGVIVGLILSIASFGLYFIGYEFITLALAQMIAAVAVAARSGTVDALIINDNKNQDQKSLARLFAKMSYINGTASLLGGIFGFLVFRLNEGFIWLIAALAYTISLFFILNLQYEKPNIDESSSLRDYLISIRSIFKNKITYLKVISDISAIGVITYWQSLFNENNSFGILFGFLLNSFAVSASSFLVRKWSPSYSRIPIIIFCSGISTLMLGIMTNLTVLLIFFLSHVMLQVAMNIIIGSEFHRKIQNNIRAGAISAVSVLSGAIGALIIFIIGLIADHISVGMAITTSSLSYALLITIFFISSPKFLFKT